MDTKTKTKLLLLKDYLNTRGDLGDFALSNMKIYDNISYELVITDGLSKGKRVTGTAVSADYNILLDLILIHEITGEYTIRVIDAQKEFFLLLAEIRDDLKQSV